jgi:hypothetical protein
MASEILDRAFALSVLVLNGLLNDARAVSAGALELGVDVAP